MGEDFKSKTEALLSKPIIRATIGLGIVGLLITGATAFYTINVANKKPPAPAPVTKAPKPKAVSALGRLEPQGEVITLAPPPNLGGAKIDKLLVKVGDKVEANQIIAILDSQERSAIAVEKAKTEIEIARANLEIIKAGAKSGEIKAQRTTIERLKQEKQGEIANLQATINRLQAQLQGEIREQKATITKWQAELNNAAIELQRYEKIAKDGVISASDLDQRRLKLDTMRASVKEAEANLEKTEDTINKEIKETQINSNKTIGTLEKEIDEARATLEKISEIRIVDVQKGEAELNKAIVAFKEAEIDFKQTYIKVPNKSQVIKINTYPGETVEKGIVELGNTEKMMVVAEVYESDIGKIRMGQTATITSESGVFKDKLKGTVSEVGLQIGKKAVLSTDPAADVDARVVEVKIFLDPEDSKKVANFTYSKVFAEIIVE